MIDNSFFKFSRLLVLIGVPFFLVMGLRELSQMKQERERISQNQDVLLHNGKVEIGQTADGKATASSAALQLRASDLRRNPDSLLAVNLHKLKINNRRVVAAASVTTSTSVEVRAAATLAGDKDYLLSSDSLSACQIYPGELSPIHRISWSDPWVRLEGTLRGDTFTAQIESRDTLQLIAHRVPRRFLFFRWGTKAVRVDVVSQNPHTRLQSPKMITFTH